jgi:DNA topoisomerase-2
MGKRRKLIEEEALSACLVNPKSVTEYWHEDYKDYAMYTILGRAIPSFVDGLKPVQRKIVATAIQHAKKLINVEALAGAMKHNFKYHHGPDSANAAIVNMNQKFQQAMPYLEADGQFGYLYDHAASAPRYLDTKVSKWTELVLKHDMDLLNNNYEEGTRLEPITYLPVLPMLLINGNDGIAVGFSTTFTNRNPLEVAYATREYLKTKRLNDKIQLTPYVYGQKGLWSWYNGKYEHVAEFHRFDKHIFRITGLPINWQLDQYIAFITNMFHQGIITDFFNFSNEDQICIDIHMTPNRADEFEANGTFARTFQLIHRLPNDNLTCILPNMTWKRYDNPIQFIKEFVDFRLGVYFDRKRKILTDIEQRIDWLNSVIRFIELIYEGVIDFRAQREDEIFAILVAYSLNKDVMNMKTRELSIDNRDKHMRDINDLKAKHKQVSKTKERDMYLADVNDIILEMEREFQVEPVLNIQEDANLIRITE